jgi:hypothetical protein
LRDAASGQGLVDGLQLIGYFPNGHGVFPRPSCTARLGLPACAFLSFFC